MGSLFRSGSVAAPQVTYNTYRDEVNGVEQVPVYNANGTVSYVTRTLPKTAAEQARADELAAIRTGALASIKALSAGDYAPDDTTQSSLAAWLGQQQRVLQGAYDNREMDEESELARRGIADSSAAESVRRQRHLDQQAATTALGQQRDQLAGDIRSQQLSLQQNLYNLANQGLSAEEARQYQAAVQSQSKAISADTQRQASLLDYYSRANSSQSPISAVLRTSVGTVAGPVNLLGSWRF